MKTVMKGDMALSDNNQKYQYHENIISPPSIVEVGE
jgi:hypothetical protein